MTTPQFGKLSKVDPRKAWTSEPADFTPWLRENVTLLAAELGLDLEATGTEVAVGKFAVDIHGKDVTNKGRPFIIENQLEETDHRHLGQLMTYAGGLDAATVIWVAPRFCEEHRRALDWLNEKTVDEVDFFGVEVELLQIDGSALAPHFRVVAQPNAWAKRTKSKTAEDATSEKASRRIEFLSHVLEAAKATQKDLTNASRVSYSSSVWFTAGRNGFYFSWNFNQAGNIRVEVGIDTGNLEANLWYFDRLQAQEDALVAALGMPIDWVRKESQKLQRLVVWGPVGWAIDRADSDVQQMEKWAVDTMLKVAASLKPRIKALPSFAAWMGEMGQEPPESS